ncbi:odorant receptor 13a-like [Rhagoletis pomonella]|uniref:odorant receptor 13a-like n=1 Tax=Rhagoletis pomonella TaxID=28610 RepID=UPI0017814F46|nr:odorant receptor 13a-like [Rhagoletis pomonella]
MLFNPKPLRDPIHFKFPVQCIWLKLNGSWPLKRIPSNAFEKFCGFLYDVWAWYVVAMVGITIGFQTAFLVTSFGDISVTTENGCTTFMGVLNFARLLHLRLHQNEFHQMIAQFVKDIWITKSSHPSVERACARNMRVYQVISVLESCLITMYCVMPLFELYMLTLNDADGLVPINKPFPYKMLFPYDANHGWRYALTYVFTAWAGVCVVTTLFAEDSLFGFFVTYTCGQLNILHKKIDNITIDSYATVRGGRGGTEADYQRECIRRLDKIAAKHSVLFDFVNQLEEFFSPIMLVNFMISSVLICMVGFQLVTGKNMFVGDYIKFLVYIFSSLSQLFVLCWNGDKIIQNSLEMATHLYACNWERDIVFAGTANNSSAAPQLRKSLPTVYYSTDKVFRSKLQFMIMRSQRPTCITAMKFSTLSLNSFSGLMSTSMSYFALLQSFYENEEN